MMEGSKRKHTDVQNRQSNLPVFFVRKLKNEIMRDGSVCKFQSAIILTESDFLQPKE